MQQKEILNETKDVVGKLNLTSGNKEKYKNYLRSFDDNGMLRGDVIESAVTTSKQMFRDTEMDTGFIGHQIFQDYYQRT